MLPPVEDAVLQGNPEFAALYSTLSTVILNPDGSTKNDPAAKERAAVREELDAHRLTSAKNGLLLNAIATAVPSDKPPPNRRAKQPILATKTEQLPPDLLDLLLLLPPLLASDTLIDPLLLNTPPIYNLPTLLPALSTLLSTTLHQQAVHLARIASPTTNPSFIHRTIPSLPSYQTTLTTSLANTKLALTNTRLSTTTKLTHLLARHTHALVALIRILESKHGAIARSLELNSSLLSLEAEKQRIEVQNAMTSVRRELYSDEIVRALGNYERHLKDAKGRVGEGIRMARRELEGYGVGEERGLKRVGKEETMREMAKVWREMGERIEEVRGDLERLGSA
ncbi:hypothetical protein OQA88_8917 [Cercophora sp. LCS_1]